MRLTGSRSDPPKKTVFGYHFICYHRMYQYVLQNCLKPVLLIWFRSMFLSGQKIILLKSNSHKNGVGSVTLVNVGAEQESGGEAEGAGQEDEVLRQGAPRDAGVRLRIQG